MLLLVVAVVAQMEVVKVEVVVLVDICLVQDSQ
jgi:hypothetical protein